MTEGHWPARALLFPEHAPVTARRCAALSLELAAELRFGEPRRSRDLGPDKQFAADIFAERDEIAAKMKFASGSGPTD